MYVLSDVIFCFSKQDTVGSSTRTHVARWWKLTSFHFPPAAQLLPRANVVQRFFQLFGGCCGKEEAGRMLPTTQCMGLGLDITLISTVVLFQDHLRKLHYPELHTSYVLPFVVSHHLIFWCRLVRVILISDA